MVDLAKTFNGTVEGAVSATSKLNGLPKILQQFMTFGDFGSGIAKKIDMSSFATGSVEIENYASQIANLDENQQSAILSATEFGEGVKKSVENILKEANELSRINSRIFESALKNWDGDKILGDDIQNLMAAGGMKNGDNYALPETDKAVDAIEKYINNIAKAKEQNRLFNAGITEMNGTIYVLSKQFKQLAGIEEAEGVVKTVLTAKQTALNIAMTLGKQLMASLIAFGISLIATKLIDWLSNLKTHSEQLIETMNSSHDAAEQAKQDVDDIQAKIDELNKTVENADANSISDIVDPTERERLQAINDMLQAQLDLKKQLEKDANNKANEDTSTVVNDKTEKSITKFHEEKTTYAESGSTNTETKQVADDITKTESLQEHSQALDNLIDKRREFLKQNDTESQAYKDNEAAITSETDKITELSTAVQEQMNGYVADADNFNQYKGEYVAGTNAMTEAAKALANAQDDTTVTKQESALGKRLRIEKKQLDETTKAYNKYTKLQNMYGQYGNIDNFNRGQIYWDDENLSKYSQFAKENGVQKGEYSTVNGSSDSFTANGEEIQIAYSPMLQTEDGVMPLTSDVIKEYVWSCIDAASEMEGGATAANILKVDKEGIYEDIDGVETRIHDMIAAVEGQIMNGAKLSALDVIAIAGATEEELGDEFGNQWSKYFGRSMHDIQSQAVDLCKIIKQKWNDIWSKDTDNTVFNPDLSNAGNIQNALSLLGGQTDAEYLKAIGQAGPKTAEQTQAFEILNKVAERLHTTYEKLIDAMEEEGMVASETIVDTTAIDEASKKLDEVQAAYKALKSAQEEYNKQGYLTADSLQTILDLDPKYQACLINENGQLQINKSTIKNLTNSYYELMKAKVYSQAIDDLKEMKTYQKAVDFLGQAKQETKDWLSLMQATANTVLEDSGLTGSGWDKLNEAQQARIKTAQNMVDLISQTQGRSLDEMFPGSSSSKSTKNTKTAIDAWSTLTSAMKEFNEQGYITFQTLKSLTDLEDKYSSMLTKNDVTGKLEMRTQAFYNLMKAELKKAQVSGDGASEAQYNKILEWTNRNINKQTMSYYDLVAAIEGYSTALEEAKTKTDAFKNAWDSGKTVKEKTEKSRTGALDYEGTEAQSSALQELKKYSEFDPELVNKAFNKETGKIDLSGDMLKTAVVKSLKEQAEAARTEGGDAAEAIARSYEISASNIEHDVISVQDYFDGLGATIDEINTKIDDMQSAWSDLSDVVDEYNKYGGLSVDSIQKLLTMSPDYLKYLTLDGDQLVFDKDAMLAFAKANLLAKANELKLKDETKDQAAILEALANSLDKGSDAMAGMGSEAEKLKSTISDLKDVFSSLLNVFKDGSSNKSNDLKLWADALNDEIDDRIEELNEQKDALSKENDEQERAIELTKAQDALARAQTQHTARVYGGNGYEWEASSADVRSAQQDLDDKRREWRNSDAEKAIDDEIEKLNDLKDEYSKVINEIGGSLDDYNKKQIYAAQIQTMTLAQMKSNLTGFKDSVLTNMMEIQTATNIENVVSGLESFISTLEKMNNIYTFISTRGQSIDGGSTEGLIKNLGKLADDISKKGLKNAIGDFFDYLRGATEETLLTSDNSIVKLFRSAWETIKSDASNFFGGNGLNKIAKDGLADLSETMKGATGGSGLIEGILGTGTATAAATGAASTATGGAGLVSSLVGSPAAPAAIGSAAAGGLASIPVLGAIAVGVNHLISEVKDVADDNKKLWADTSKSTGEKIVDSIGNVLYHLTPVEGWSKAMQYAEKTAEADGIWEKICNGAKAVYYGCGLGTILDNIWDTIKKIFNIQDEAAKKEEANSTTTTKDVSSNKNLSVNGTEVTTTTTGKVSTDPSGAELTDSETKEKAGPSVGQWVTNPLGSSADALTGYDYNNKENNNVGQNLVHAITHPIETVAEGIGNLFSAIFKHASGVKSVSTPHLANVDEQGQEFVVRQPAAGRYTYLETGDGVVPADITSKLFEMGGNPDKWFSEQISKYDSASNIQTRTVDNRTISIGDVVVNNPVGGANDLARALVQKLPSAIDQQMNKR